MDIPLQEHFPAGRVRLPESPEESMEFLSRSWSASAVEISKALTPRLSMLSKVIAKSPVTTSATFTERVAGGCPGEPTAVAGNPFPLAHSPTSQLVLDRILMPHSQPVDVSPITSGRLSHSSGPLNGGSSATDSDGSSLSHSDELLDDVVKLLHSKDVPQPHAASGRGGAPTGGKTVGRWLKDRREKKKEECRAHNAQLQAAISVAGVAAAVAAIAAATAASSKARKGEQTAKTDTAVASAATLVAAQCVEAAEALGAERDHLATVISSAVNISSYGDIMTLTAAAATALRGAATLKARAMKEAWNIAAVLPVEKTGAGAAFHPDGNLSCDNAGEPIPVAKDFLTVCSQEFLARGCELLKRTRQGELHWMIVSVYIDSTGQQVVLKMKNRERAIAKTKKNVVVDVCKEVAAWPGRHLLEAGEQRRYFGLNTQGRGLIEFECKNHEYDLWTQGVPKLLSITAEKNRKS